MKYIATLCATALVLASCGSFQAKKPFTVDIDAPRYAAGSADLQVDKMLTGIKKTDVDLYYYPDDDAVCLEFRSGVFFSQFWSREGREAFIEALELYKADYEERNLLAKGGRKTKRAYGKVQGYIVWSTTRILSEQAKGISTIDIGYTFKDRMPFFSIMQEKAGNEIVRGDQKKVSPEVMLYFTRAQAEVIADLFNQEHLEGIEQTGGTKTEGLRGLLRDIFNI
ncbi:MAG: hypothetical protein LBG95_04475 [Treponema sp.]|jgi:hypothetical protein|nr:hypothetical protein [Treponema sp.]